MPTIRLTASNIASILADWSSGDAPTDTLAFSSAQLSPDEVRAAAWSAGIIVSVDPIAGELYRVTFVERVIESN